MKTIEAQTHFFALRRSTKFKSFPDVLVFRMNKFQLLNWVPTKLGESYQCAVFGSSMILIISPYGSDVPVLVEDELAMESYVSEGKQPGEVELAETDDGKTCQSATIDKPS
jgi:ubiquitin carboxyl-terminal hydrolase 5/13